METNPDEIKSHLSAQNNQEYAILNFPTQTSREYFSSGPQIDNKTNLNLQKKNDQNFINDFLSKVEKIQKTDFSDSPIKISEGKMYLFEIISQRKKLETDIHNLQVNDENFDLKFNDLMEEIDRINEKIIKFNTDLKIPLKNVICKRKKKREAIRRKNRMYKALKEKKQKDIKEKHEIINKLLSERSEEVEAGKREAALKRQADSVLHEVRKKKFEAKKMLNLLTALAKLRELRSEEEEKRGGYCSKQLAETFNNVIGRFKNLWENQISVYKLEEKGLKIMLEENALPYEKESKFEMNLLEWEKVLFGDVPNNDYERILTAADSDFQELVKVRRDWDQFLVNESTAMASSIPPGWVLPLETEDEEWKAFAKHDKKTS